MQEAVVYWRSIIMVKIIAILLVVAAAALGALWYFNGANKPRSARSKELLYDCSFTAIDGKRVRLSEFRGKKILIVNVASECGFTPQYEELEKLYRLQKGNLVIIGFPANDFMGQEPGSNEEIRNFCTARYGVTFPLSQKVSVVGDSPCEVFRWLTRKEANGWNNQAPRWNFYKYLIDERGELTNVFPSSAKPMGNDILAAIQGHS
jgi:glutathione peroxidase